MGVDWDDEKIRHLITLRGIEYAHYFEKKIATETTKGWAIIKEKMNTELSLKSLYRKWYILQERYKRMEAKIYNESDEFKKKVTQSWRHYDLMNLVLKDKFIIYPSSATSKTSISINVENSVDKKFDEKKVKELEKEKFDFNYSDEELQLTDKNYIVDHDMNKLCGEIFAAINFTLSFKCYLCRKIFTNIEEFSRHVPDLHPNLFCKSEDKSKNIEEISTKRHRIIDLKKFNGNFNFETVLIQDNNKGYSNSAYISESLNNKISKQEKVESNVLSKYKILENSSLTNSIHINFNSKLASNVEEDVNDCDKSLSQSFNNTLNLQNKQLINKGLKRNEIYYPCDICEEDFTTKTALNRHNKTIHSEDFIFSNYNCKAKLDYDDDRKSCLEYEKLTEKFICDICKKIFDKKYNLSIHQKIHYKFQHCEKAFIPSSTKNIHERWHQKEKLYNCKECGKSFIQSNNLLKHVKTHCITRKSHNPNHSKLKLFICKICYAKFSVKSLLEIHENEHVAEDKKIDVTEMYRNKTILNRDIKKEDNSISTLNTDKLDNENEKQEIELDLFNELELRESDTNVKLKSEQNSDIEDCDKGFSLNLNTEPNVSNENIECDIEEYAQNLQLLSNCKKGDLKQENKPYTVQSKNKVALKRKILYSCDICDQSFTTKRDLNFHNKEIHLLNSAKFICETCKLLFKTKSDRDEHKSSCFGIKIVTERFICEICNKEFYKKASFKSHCRRHTLQNNRPHQCHLCEKSFIDSTNYKCHIRRHLGVKKHKCQYCEKAFVSTTEKKIHERSHRDEKPFLCTECGKSYRTSSHLTHHLKSHSGTKPYKCENCEKSFHSLAHLKAHSSVHSGLKPYKCKICDALFSRNSAMKMHERLHSDVAKYACKICDKKFKQHAGMYSHMKSHNIAKNDFQ